MDKNSVFLRLSSLKCSQWFSLIFFGQMFMAGMVTGARASAILDRLDASTMLYSVRYFPDNRSLEGRHVSTAKESHVGVYDPAFLLPALCLAFETGQV